MILHIIGLILKIIGIILLVILGILVLLIGIILFVPLRYEVAADFPGNLNEVEGTLKISWLLHLLSGKIIYKDGDLRWQGRIFWKKLGDIPKKEQKEKKEQKTVEKPVKKAVETPIEKKTTSLERTEKKEPEKREQRVTTQPEESSLLQEKKVPEKQVAAKNADGSSHKKIRKRKRPVKAFGRLIRKVSQKIREFLKKIKCTWKNICDKIKNISDKKEKILTFLEKENHKAAFERGKKELVWVRRFIKPKKLKANIHFGFEDPYHTGQALALGGVLYAFIGENVELEPDFEKRVLDGNVFMKGRLRAFYAVMFVVKMILDKNVRSTYHDIRAFEW